MSAHAAKANDRHTIAELYPAVAASGIFFGFLSSSLASLRYQGIERTRRGGLAPDRQVLEKSAGSVGPVIASQMQDWLQTDDFASVRRAESLAKLAEEERSTRQKPWADVTGMLVKAQGKAPAEKKPDAKSPPR